jgi:RimJ/RimL family protein N-acetyltransferase
LHGPPPLKVAETARLRLRWFHTGDSLFILRLLNEPSWIRFIGDKGIKSRDDAIRYIENGPVAMYGRMGFGLYAVELKESAELPDFWRNGYAFEAASAVMSFGKRVLGLDRIVAILSQDNDPSRKLLEKLGFEPEGTITFQPTDEELHLYAFVCAKQ